MQRVARCSWPEDRECISDCRGPQGTNTPQICPSSAAECTRHRPTLFVSNADIEIDTEAAVQAFARRVLSKCHVCEVWSECLCEGVE